MYTDLNLATQRSASNFSLKGIALSIALHFVISSAPLKIDFYQCTTLNFTITAFLLEIQICQRRESIIPSDHVLL